MNGDGGAARTGPPGEGDVDWFGFPLERPRAPVPCPRCGEGFVDREAYARHLQMSHRVRAEGGGKTTKGELPALGRNRRGRTSRRLRTVPLVVVMAANVALAVAFLGAMGAVGPAWWDDLMDENWSAVVLIPLLWPTIAFLALRGIPD